MVTQFGYWQWRPYVSRYYVYDSPAAARNSIYQNSRRPIGEVSRDGSKWHASLHSDPLITGVGRTRDAAVNDAFSQVGGQG